MWNFQHSYNKRAAGHVKKFNLLLETEITLTDSPMFQETLDVGCFNLKSRETALERLFAKPEITFINHPLTKGEPVMCPRSMSNLGTNLPYFLNRKFLLPLGQIRYGQCLLMDCKCKELMRHWKRNWRHIFCGIFHQGRLPSLSLLFQELLNVRAL